jgi:small-conductance mechanosensitive channel
MKIQYWQILALALMTGVLTGWIIIRLLLFLSRKQKHPLFRTVHHSITNVLFFFFPVLFITLVANNRFVKSEESYLVYSLSKVFLIAVSTWLAIRIVAIFERLILDQLDLNKTNNLQERKLFTKVKFIKRLVVIAVLIISVSLLLLSFRQGREFGLGILTSAGIVSVIVGFAAQKTIANLLAGIQIAFTQPIKIEDVVIVENEWGRIEEINLTYVVVKLWDLRRLILPITYFVENSYQNWTRNDSSIIGTALFSLDYQTPVDTLRTAFLDILAQSPLWDGDTAALQVTDTRDQYMVVRAIMSARNASDAFDLRCEVREKLIGYMKTNSPESLPRFSIDYIKSGSADARPL